MSQDGFEPHSDFSLQLKLKFSWLQNLGSGAWVGQIASLYLTLWQTAVSTHEIGVHFMGNQARWSLSHDLPCKDLTTQKFSSA